MKIPMTLNGQAQLREELENLEISLSEIADAIGEAIKHGDLSENADYHANKNKQGMVLAKIAQIKSRLASAQVIDVTKLAESSRVVFGTTVTLLNMTTEQRNVYQIVGEDEADVALQKLSINTPVARALISREQGEVVEIDGVDQLIRYRIEKVEYI
ncbi:MAG: transcription elongation factor GreA [Gammaproteobacteria bacterium]|nr:transcription elongation factor GreA [Gammaproteobacteria bacterium]